MKTLSSIIATLLGLMFVVFGLNFFLHFFAVPQPPECSDAAKFFGAMGAGYWTLIIKTCENSKISLSCKIFKAAKQHLLSLLVLMMFHGDNNTDNLVLYDAA